MSANRSINKPSLSRLFDFVFLILGPESSFYYLAVVYGIGVSLLSLAVPISVQMLINTVANTGLPTPLVLLSLSLFGLLLISGLLRALRIRIMDIFQRRFYARMVSEIAVRSIYALNPFFQDNSKGDLFNRYFDIVIVQKNLPTLLVSGFTIVLQAGVGFILVSLYHPLFLLFNLVVATLIWLIWTIWGARAIRSAIQTSHRKHATAEWLEGLGMSNGFFKSERHIEHALRRTDEVTRDYIDQHATHFRHHFAQTIGFLLLYAAASASLLGLGGWLVIEGQLTLGQLVAAELVLSVAFYGVSQLGIYLSYFYELCGAIDELSLFYDIEQEDPDGAGDTEPQGDASLAFYEAHGDGRGNDATLNLEIPSGSRVMAVSENHGVQREMTNFLKRHESPGGGYVSLGGIDIESIRPHALRQQIIVLDRPNAVTMTIRQYLERSADKSTQHDVLQVIKTVGLDRAIALLDKGMETRISSTGWPLSIMETMQLKLAAAIIARPRVLVLNQLLDVMPDQMLKDALDQLQSQSVCTVIYFTNRYRPFGFDRFLYLGKNSQPLYDNITALHEKLSQLPDSARMLSIGTPVLGSANSLEEL